MARIATHELEGLLPQLPHAEPLGEDDPTAEIAGDVFLCALGFEPRCLSVPELFGRRQVRFRHAWHIGLTTNVVDNERNLPALVAHLSLFASDVQSLNADDTHFERRLRLLLSGLRHELGRSPVITCDISVAANRLLLRTLKVLVEADIELRVVYSEAEVYHPTRDEYENDRQKWTADESLGTEQGVGLVIPSPSYAGQQLDPLPNCVVLFPSFRKERSLAVLSAVDETLVTSRHQDVIWILGKPHLAVDSWRTEAMREINEIPHDAPQYEVSTFDYWETLMALERIYRERWERYNITLSPLGSKLQAIGTALFCYLHPEVRVIFSAPRKYNAAEWSSGSREIWKINVGSTEQLRHKMDLVGTISVAH